MYTLILFSSSGDALTSTSVSYGYHDGKRFQTIDNPVENDVGEHAGGWWYTDSFYGKLTGYYGSTPSWKGIIWEVWLYINPVAYADMKIRVN